jgi:hypothetical protein
MEGRLEDRALAIRVDVVNRFGGGPLSWTGTNTVYAPRNRRRVISGVDALDIDRSPGAHVPRRRG